MRRAVIVLAWLMFFALSFAPYTTAIEVGDKAPDFELDSTKDGKLKLSSFHGKKNVVIQFYVLDFTPT